MGVGHGEGGDNSVLPFEDERVGPAIPLSPSKLYHKTMTPMGSNHPRSRGSTYHDDEYYDTGSVENGMYPRVGSDGTPIWSVMDDDTR